MEAGSYLLQIYLPTIHLSMKHSSLNKFITHLLIKTVNIITLEAEEEKKKKKDKTRKSRIAFSQCEHLRGD